MDITFAGRQRDLIGATQDIAQAAVHFVDPGAGRADIEYRRFVKNYDSVALRRYFVTATRQRYATLEAAVRAVIAHRATQELQP